MRGLSGARMSTYIVRRAKNEDAAELHRFFLELPSASPFVLSSADDPQVDFAQRKTWLEAVLRNEANLLLVATFGEAITGALFVERGRHRKTRHRGDVAISVASEHRGQRIGHRLMDELDRWMASHAELRSVRAGVMDANTPCLKLLTNHGFRIQARIAEAFVLDDGQFCDEVILVKTVR